MAARTCLAIVAFTCHTLLASTLEIKQSENDTESWQVDLESFLITPPDKDCSRGHDCGYEGGVTKEIMKVPCKSGEKWMAPNAVVIRGKQGKTAIYCSVPKIATSYMFGVMQDLGLPVRTGKRNAAYENVGDIVHRNNSREVEQLCEAHSFLIIRNPWERIVSAYVDKVLTREVFRVPPEFPVFMQALAGIKQADQINQHFRPVSELCHTSGARKHVYNEKVYIENRFRTHLEDIFVNQLSLSKDEVRKVLDEFETNTHPTTQGSRWTTIDSSLDSGLDRVSYYFQQSDPILAAKLYKEDISFGDYKYGTLSGGVWKRYEGPAQ